MFSRSETLVLLFGLSQFCLAKDRVRFGVFLNDGQENNFHWDDAIEADLNDDVDLTHATQIVSDKDIFEAKLKLCDFIEHTREERILAVLGPKSESVSSLLSSTCAHLNIPYLITTATATGAAQSHDNVIDLYPDSDLLKRGLASIVRSFDWSRFVILYEDDEGLMKLQDVLKLEAYDRDKSINSILMRKLEIDGDNRGVLKSLRNSPYNRFILDCHVDRVMEIFRQAESVGLLSDFSISFFLTSLDGHTLDFSAFKTQINITTIRLFDPANVNFQRIVSEYLPELQPTKIRVETALKFDAAKLLVETVNVIKAEGMTSLLPREITCANRERYEDDLGLIDALKKMELDGLTGPIRLPNGNRDNFHLEVIEINKPDKPIAIWNSENAEDVRLTRNATEREEEVIKRLQSYNFIVTSRVGPPYLFENTNEDGPRYYGYSIDLITEITKFINISFQLRIAEGNSYANLVADLIERRADLGICDFTITPQRREMIDFSMPFMSLGIGILHKASTHEAVDNMYAFMRPISWNVWVSMGTLSLLSSLTMFVVARLSRGEWENPKPWDPETKELENIWTVKNFLWLSLGSITAQGCDILPKSVPTRIITAAWWVFALIIINSYIANLAAFLTMDKQDVTVDTVEELAAQSKIKFGLMAKGSTEAFFSTSNNSLYQKMWNTMKNEKPSVFEKDNVAGVERVLSTKNGLYAYFMESTGIEYEMERHCELRRIGDKLDSKSYGIGMPLDADYRHIVNSAILRLQESGKLAELKELWWKKKLDGPPCDRTVEENSNALALSNVGGIFIVLAIGVGLAYVIAIVEFLWHVRDLAIEEHLSFWDTLKCEVRFACRITERKKRAKPVPSESSSSSESHSPEIDQDKISAFRSVFSKSASMLNMSGTEPNEMHRPITKRSPSKTSGGRSNRLRVE